MTFWLAWVSLEVDLILRRVMPLNMQHADSLRNIASCLVTIRVQYAACTI